MTDGTGSPPQSVPVTGHAGELQAFAQDGLVWVNAPARPEAVVFSGRVHRPIRKYAAVAGSPEPTATATSSQSPSPEPTKSPPPSAQSSVGPTASASSSKSTDSSGSEPGSSPTPDPGQSSGPEAPSPSPTAAPPASPVRCGATLTESATLDHDLDCTTSIGVIIGANDVTLDLNGHTIRYTSGFAGDERPIGIRITGVRGTEIRNGSVRGFRDYIDIRDAQDVLLSGLDLVDFRVGLRINDSRGVHLERTQVVNADNGAVTVDVANSEIQGTDGTNIAGFQGNCYQSTCTMLDSSIGHRYFYINNGSTFVFRRGQFLNRLTVVYEGCSLTVTDSRLGSGNLGGTGERVLENNTGTINDN
ncbi:hypothetical protein [Cryptosporangium arvum]|uniref:hypothetical protein n=1 Tax=Cryptosporangium arvum TaxID=80871 RepID=UPI0012EDB6A8|nr:hypothetical protein [Cryptosporangium arvum]